MPLTRPRRRADNEAGMPIRLAVASITFLVLTPVAHAGCPVKVSAVRGSAPLAVTFRAVCHSRSYHWAVGDGAVGHGRAVTHSYGGGRFTPVLRSDTGTSRLAAVESVSLELVSPRKTDYGQHFPLRGRAVPAG